MRYAAVLALSLAWQTVSAVAPSAPDFTSQVSREEAVVVSITTVSLESPFILDPDDAAVREGSDGLLRTVPLASA